MKFTWTRHIVGAMTQRVLAVFAFVVLLAFPAVASVRAPIVSVQDIDDLPMPLPYPYDESADANTAVAHTLDLADYSGKQVIIDLGANWCAECRILAAIMRLPEMRAFIQRHYEIVSVDVGNFDRNLQISGHYGVFKLAVLPTLIITESDGRPVTSIDAAELSDGGHVSPQQLADWLARWAR